MINGQSEKQISQPKKQAKLHFLWPNSQEPRVQLIEQWKQLICSRDVLHSKQVSMSNSTFLQPSKHNLKTKYNFWCVYFTCYGVLIQLCRTLCDPMDRSPSGSSVHRHSPGKNTGVGCHALSRGSSKTRNWTQVSHIVGGFFTVCATRESIFIL